MKKDGFSYIEIVVSIFLFIISLIPLVKYTDDNHKIYRKFLDLERDYKNFSALEKQLKNRENSILIMNLGKKEYCLENLGTDKLTENLYLPYEVDKNFKLLIELSKFYFIFKEEKYEYIKLNIIYMNKNKKISSEKYIDPYRREYEKIK